MCKTYIDSDGVLADFDNWVLDKDPSARDDPEKYRAVMINFKKDCFLKSKTIPHRDFFFEELKQNPNCYVLTALTSRDHFLKDGFSDKEISIALKFHRENKYKWFEKRGIPREKVIICNDSRDKVAHCNPGDILYDDFESNIKAWNNAGGIGIRIANKVCRKLY